MQDIAALTPPLLVCAVVIIAIVAFLRHEMSRSRTDESAPGDQAPATAENPDAGADREQNGSADAPDATGGDRHSRR